MPITETEENLSLDMKFIRKFLISQIDEKLFSQEADIGGTTRAIVNSLYRSGNASLYRTKNVEKSTRLSILIFSAFLLVTVWPVVVQLLENLKCYIELPMCPVG